MKDQLLRAFDEAHKKLIVAAAAAATRGIVQEGEWGPREVLAHIVGWEAEATERVPQLAAGAASLTYDDDAFNAAVITVLGDQPFEQVRDTLRRTHQRLVRILMAQEDRVFTPDHNTYKRVKTMTRHSAEHAQGLNELV